MEMMEVLQAADLYLLHMINPLAGQWPMLDRVVGVFRDVHPAKAAPVVALWWWLWFTFRTDPQMRARLLAVLVISFPAIALGRVMALALPLRLRPLHEPGMSITPPEGMPEQMLSGWSAMPSDHAVMFMSIAVGLWFASRAAGAVAVAFAMVFVCLPRVYSGLHYPSDILVGSLTGALVALALMPWLTRRIGRIPLGQLNRVQEASITFASLIVSLQIATMFETPRYLLRSLPF